MSEKGRGCPLRSRSVARRLDLNVPEQLGEAGASAGEPGVVVGGSSVDDGPSKAAQVDGQAERVAPADEDVGAGPAAGGPTVVAAPEHGAVLSPPSPPASERRSEMGRDDPSHLTPDGLHYRWHRCAVVNISLDEVLGLGPPASERLEIRRLKTMLQARDELAHQRLKAYLGDSAVWLAPPDLPGEAYFVFKAWEVVYYDRAAYLLSSSDSGVTDFASPWTVIPEAVAFPRSGYDARLELTASNARRRFGRVFMSMDYQLMHQAGSDPVRVAPDASLHQRADLETLPEVPQVMRDLEVPHGLPVAAPLLVCYFGSSLSTRDGNAKSLFESMLTSEWLFNIAEAYLHEAVFAQRVWLLPSATASAAEEHWPRFPTRSLAWSDIKAFPKRLLSGDGLVALLRRTASEPLERRISRVSFTTGVAHHYISYDSASDSFFEDPHVRRKESRLAVRGRNEASLTVLSPPGGSGKYFGGFGSASGRGSGERRSGNPLSVRIAPHFLRGLPQVDALFDEAQISRGPPIGELLSHACHMVQRARSDLSRCSDDLARARRELARTEADLHASQVKVAALEARVQAVEMTRTFVPYQAPPVGYGTGYSYAPMQAVSGYVPGKRSRDAAYGEPSGTTPFQAMVPASQAPMSAYQTSLQASYVTPPMSDDPYAAPRARIGGEGSARAGPVAYATPLHVARGEEVVGSGGGEPRRAWGTDPYQPAYPSYNVPSEGANVAAVQIPRSSESTVEAPLRSYRPGFRDPFAQPRGFPPPTTPFTGGSSSSGGRPGPSQRR